MIKTIDSKMKKSIAQMFDSKDSENWTVGLEILKNQEISEVHNVVILLLLKDSKYISENYLLEKHPTLYKTLQNFCSCIRVTSVLYSELQQAILAINTPDVQAQAKKLLEKRIADEILEGLHKSNYYWIEELKVKITV
jgi:hypothetical protein